MSNEKKDGEVTAMPVDPNDDFFESDEDDFQPCDNCDLPDACADFGCAIKKGIKRNYDF